MRKDTRTQYFYFLYVFLKIVGNELHWTILLDTYLDLLLPFKWNWIRLGPEQLFLNTKNAYTFFYKNKPYKNNEAEIGQKIRIH